MVVEAFTDLYNASTETSGYLPCKALVPEVRLEGTIHSRFIQRCRCPNLHATCAAAAIPCSIFVSSSRSPNVR